MRCMLRGLALIIAASFCAAGCGEQPPQSPDPGVPSGEAVVAPGDRLGWTQQFADASEAGFFQYALYVDGNRTVLAGATCTAGAGGGTFDCSATLPSLTAGVHILELASFVADGSETSESAKSPALRVVAVSASRFSVAASLVVTAEQVRLNLQPVAEGLHMPSDLAFAGDGSIFVAQRDGLVRLIRDGVLQDTPALDLSPDISTPESGLLAIALDPKFDENQFLYSLSAVDAPRDGLEFTLARFRQVNGVFGERVVMLDRTKAAASGASGAVRAGPDGKLYVALDSSSDGRIAGSFANYNGKVLRFNTDGTTPVDQPSSNPIHSLEHPQPLALDWQPASRTMWVVDRVGTDAGRLSAVVKDANQSRAAARTSYALPPGTGAASAAFYRGDLMPIFKGNLFIAAEMGRQLIRLRFDPDNASKIVTVERMLQDQIGAVRVVAEGRDGGLYIATESVLYRLAP